MSNKNIVDDIRKYAVMEDKVGVKNPEDVLVILVGIFNSNYVSGRNIIRLNNTTGKMRTSGVDKRYCDAKDACKYVSRLNKAIIKNEITELEAEDRSPRSVWTLWLLILFTLGFSAANYLNNDMYSVGVETLRAGQTYRLLTYMFVHAGIFHLVGNMISLGYIGKQLMAKIGAIDFFLIYIFGGMSAGAMSMYIYSTIFNKMDMSTVGASGAIFAVLGALVSASFVDRECTVNKPVLLRNAIIVLIISSVGYNIDWACHIVGFLVGAASAAFIMKGRQVHADAKSLSSRDSIDGIKKTWEEQVARIRSSATVQNRRL